MVGYLFYLATGWQGIHTIMLSSLIVAQPSLGATSQRGILRIGGAALGSAIALAMVVWVVPRLDGIVGLLLMSLPVIALGAWISAGSERISYAGTQLMFTFGLALLGQFAPTTNLTEIRDRIVGILLGVSISTVVHASISPEAEGEALRQRVGALLRKLAASLRQQEDAISAPNALWSELADCEAMAARVALEPGWQMGEGQREGFQHHIQTVLAQTREILLAAGAFEAERRSQPNGEGSAQRAAAIWATTVGVSLEGYASNLTGGQQSVHAPAPVFSDEEALLFTDAAKGAYDRLTTRATRLMGLVSTLPAWRYHQFDNGIVR
ncbi:membrane protein-like protein [Burkholderia sp. H160]|nr:membrane protein-like protein [Burkholderia sp. H160]